MEPRKALGDVRFVCHVGLSPTDSIGMKRTVTDSQMYAKLIAVAADLDDTSDKCWGVIAATSGRAAAAVLRRLASALYQDKLKETATLNHV